MIPDEGVYQNPDDGVPESATDYTTGYHRLNSPIADERRPMLVRPFIREGDAVLLTGARGQGKSTWAADYVLAHLIPDGLRDANTAFCGAFEVDRDIWGDRNVCIMDAENEPAEWKDLLQASVKARGQLSVFEDMLGRVIWSNARQHNWDNLEWMRGWMLAEFIPELLSMRVGLLIMDSMHAIWTKELFMPDWVTGGVEPLRAALKSAKITLLCLTHTSRDHKDKLAGNKFMPFGTTRQEQACDTMIGIERKPEDRTITLRLEKRRAGKWNVEGSKCKLAESPTFGGYQRIITNEWLHENPRPEEGEELILMEIEKKILNEAGGVEFDLGTLTGNRKRNKVVVESLVNAGILEITGGRGVKGDPVRYKITEMGKQALEKK